MAPSADTVCGRSFSLKTICLLAVHVVTVDQQQNSQMITVANGNARAMRIWNGTDMRWPLHTAAS